MKKKRIFPLILMWLIPLVILVLYYFANRIWHFAFPCILHELTNLYCPTCGITRLLFALLKGDIKSAFGYNQLLFILLPLLFIYLVVLSYLWLNDKINTKFINLSKKLIILVTILLVVFGVIRNLDWFSYLRP